MSAESVDNSVCYLKPALDAFDAGGESIHDVSVLDDFALVSSFVSSDACNPGLNAAEAALYFDGVSSDIGQFCLHSFQVFEDKILNGFSHDDVLLGG